MKRQGIWNFYAKRYHQLFTQKYSLKPTRLIILEWLASFITNKQKTYKILDCGCGTGQLIFNIKEKFSDFKLDITGIDFSQEMIEIAKNQNKDDDISFKCGNVAEINFEDEYDIIISTHAMPYFPNMKESMQKFYELLKSDGIFCLGQAAGNNTYDKIILTFLEIVSSEAKYPATATIQNWLKEMGFIDIKLTYIKEKRLMPTIFAICCRKD